MVGQSVSQGWTDYRIKMTAVKSYITNIVSVGLGKYESFSL